MAHRVADDITARGGRAVASCRSVEDGAAIITDALTAFGRVDILINNAGGLRDAPFRHMTEEHWNAVLRVHLHGAYRTARAAWAHFWQQSYGRIINTVSAAGLYGNAGQANYASAKAALYGPTRTLAAEGRGRNILVNAVAPAAGTRLWTAAANRSQQTVSHELGARLHPAHVAPLVTCLCGEHSTETGGLFEAGGGWFAKLRWQRAHGLRLDNPEEVTAETLADNWNAFVDLTTATHPATIHDTVNAITGTTPDPSACQDRQANPTGGLTPDEDQQKRRD